MQIWLGVTLSIFYASGQVDQMPKCPRRVMHRQVFSMGSEEAERRSC